MAIAFCLDCEEPVRVLSPKLGQRIICENCQAELEIIEVSPLEFDWPYDEPAEGWEEVDDDDEWSDDDDEWEDDWDDEDEDEWEETDDVEQ